MVDEARRILCEAIIPYLMQNKDKLSKEVQKKITVKKAQLQRQLTGGSKVADSSADNADSANKSSQSEEEMLETIVEEELAELEKEEIEQFDDYLEMIMTFGYITLFAAAFPFGTTITSLFIYLETKSDMFKFERTARRPLSRKAHNIGAWEYALDILTFGSVFTNIVLCCYASDQIDYVLPWLKNLREDSATSIITVFGIEHVMICFVLLVRLCIYTEPRWLRIFNERLMARNARKQEKSSLKKRDTVMLDKNDDDNRSPEESNYFASAQMSHAAGELDSQDAQRNCSEDSLEEVEEIQDSQASQSENTIPTVTEQTQASTKL